MEPFVVEERAGYGRCVVASRDIAPLELVLADAAAVSGPEEHNSAIGGGPVCLACYCPTDGVCTACGLPACDDDCSRQNCHADFECRLLAERGIVVSLIRPLLKCILPLRMLLLLRKGTHPSIGRLMDHNETRAKDVATWNAYQTQVVNYLRDELGLADLFSVFEVNRCIGIIRTNGIETRSYKGEYYL